MKKYFLLILCLFSTCFYAKATHIVGGEFELQHLNNFNFRLFLNLYFDDVNGNQEAKDQEVTVYIYAKATDVLIDVHVLPLVEEDFVPYTNPECTNPQLRTNRLRYRRDIILSPNLYNQAQGYYVVWERCCRNNTISNIINPEDVGMAFYMEFPAVRRNGADFFNSTPAFSIPAGDYLCSGEEIFINFGATDVDGDQLVYSIVDPIAGNSSPLPDGIIPPPAPRPYAPVLWRNGFSAQTAISHDTNFPEHQFRINPQTGQLSVTPNQLGLFVFAVLCEEFRNGQRISITQREFQLMVLDCPTNASPSLQLQSGTENNSPVFYQSGQTLEVNALNDELCFTLWLKDPDPNEQLRIELNGINFQPRQPILSASQGIVNGANDSLAVQLCWPRCLFSTLDNDGNVAPYVFDLIVFDDRCPASASDTLRVSLISPPVAENPPSISTNAPLGSSECGYALEITVNDFVEFTLFAEDLIDNDLLNLEAVGRGFDLEALGMSFQAVSGVGSIESVFRWQTDCRAIRQSSNEYIIDFIATDEGFCRNQETVLCVKIILNDLPIELDGFLPSNAFTPNGDGKNDFFHIPNLPEENCLFGFESIKIHNRWGNLVFESNDKNFTWNGDELPAGVYFYSLDYRSKVYKGTVSLIR